jgi:hypothetical protein
MIDLLAVVLAFARTTGRFCVPGAAQHEVMRCRTGTHNQSRFHQTWVPRFAVQRCTLHCARDTRAVP